MYKIVSPFDKHVWFYSPYEVSWKQLIPRAKVSDLSLLKKYVDLVCPWFSEIDVFANRELVTKKLRDEIQVAIGLSFTEKEKLDSLETIFNLLHEKKNYFMK